MKRISKHDINAKLNDNHYSDKTTGIYQSWIMRFVKYHHLNHQNFEIKHIQNYLAHLSHHNFKASTHNQAVNALVFFYQKMLGIKISKAFISELRFNHKTNLPDILSKKQIESIIYHLKGHYQLLVYLLYGCGLRSSEALNIQIKDLNLDDKQLHISDAKHQRVLPVPNKIISSLKYQIDFVSKIYDKDSQSKFFHNSGVENCYLFPMKQLCNNESGKLIRTQIISNTLNYNIITASKKAKIACKVTAQTFRHSYAVHLLQNQIDIKTVQKLLGHQYGSSTLIYAHAVQKISKNKVLSPLDME
ncbi:Integrase [uncultured Candidatus Thioglobus sp.]|nr:Integrase [uncultured Candidatus Thioglobus sp.]